MRAHEVLDEVDLGAAEKAERHLVDEHPGPIAFDQEVIFGACVIKAEIILVTRTTAAVDGNTEHDVRAFGSRQSDDPLGSTGAYAKIRPVDDCVQGLRPLPKGAPNRPNLL